MIVELFGPPGSGKTTLAPALESRLREAGYLVESVLSSRPAECDPANVAQGFAPKIAALIHRATVPIAGIARVLRDPAAHDQPSARLIELHPPASPIWRIRLSQYLMRLSHSWARARRTDHIFLFDQGYVQFVCSLLLLGGNKFDDKSLENLLDAIPNSDLKVGVEAPRVTLEERLRERYRLQGWVERFLELDLQTNLDSIDVIAGLEETLRRRGEQVISVSSVDQASMMAGVSAVHRKLDELWRSGDRAPSRACA